MLALIGLMMSPVSYTLALVLGPLPQSLLHQASAHPVRCAFTMPDGRLRKAAPMKLYNWQMKRPKPQHDEDHIAAGASDGDARKQDHDAAPFAGSALGIIAGEVAGGVVGGPLGAIVGGVLGAVAGGVAGEEATRIAEPPEEPEADTSLAPKE
jgi:hypothetical protein